jgi:hypothetical protein
MNKSLYRFADWILPLNPATQKAAEAPLAHYTMARLMQLSTVLIFLGIIDTSDESL